MPIAEASFNTDKMTMPSSPNTKMEATDSAEAVPEDLDMNLDSFKISGGGPPQKQLHPEMDVDSENRPVSEEEEDGSQQHLPSAKHNEEQGHDEHEYDQARPQPRDQPEPRLESLSRLALALAQEEEDAKQGSDHDRYVSRHHRDGESRRGDPSENDDRYRHYPQQQQQQQQQYPQPASSPSPPAAHMHSYSDREATTTATQEGRPSPFQPHPYPSSPSYISQQPPHPHTQQQQATRHTQPQPRQLPPALSSAQLPHLPSSSPSPTSAHPYSPSHSRYPPLPPPPPPSSSSSSSLAKNPSQFSYTHHHHQYAHGEPAPHRRHSVSDDGSDPDLADRAQPSYHHYHHPQWSRPSASFHFQPRSSSPPHPYRSPPTSSFVPSGSTAGNTAAAAYSGSADPYRSAFDHTPPGSFKSQQQPSSSAMPLSPPAHQRHGYGYNSPNNYEGPLPALAPRPSQPYADDRSSRSGPRSGSPSKSPRSSLDGRTGSSVKQQQQQLYREPLAVEGHGTLVGSGSSSSSLNNGVVIQSARGTPKGPLPIEVQIKLLRSVLQHDPFNCAIRKTTHAWESISREQGIRARTCARRFDNIIQAYIAGRDKPIGTEEQQRTKKELLEKLFEMMNQPQALKRMQKKRRYRSEESDRRLLVETIRLNPFAQKVGQVAKAWEDIRDALNMKVHARQCIRRVNRMVKPYLLRERMYRGNIPEEMREANDDLIKQVIQLMKQAGGNQLDDDYISNASSHEDSASGMSESEEEDLDDQENPRAKRRATSAEDDELTYGGGGGGGQGEDDDDMKDQSDRHRHARHSRQSSLPTSSQQQGSPRMGGHRTSSQRLVSRRGRSRTVTISAHPSHHTSGDGRSNNRSDDYRNSPQYSTPTISTSQGPATTTATTTCSATNQSTAVVTPTTPSFPSSGYHDDSHQHHHYDHRYASSSSKYPNGDPSLPSPVHPSHSSPPYPPSSSSSSSSVSSSHYYYMPSVVSPKTNEPSYPRWPPNPAHFIDVDGSGYKRPTKHARADSLGSRFQLGEGGVGAGGQNQAAGHLPRSQQQQQQAPQSPAAGPNNNYGKPPVFKNEQGGQGMRYGTPTTTTAPHLQSHPTMFKSPVMDRYDSSAERQSRPIQGAGGSSNSSNSSPSTLPTTLPLSVPSPALSTRGMMEVDPSTPTPQQQLQQQHLQQGYHPPQPYPQEHHQQQNGHGGFKASYLPHPLLQSRNSSGGHGPLQPSILSPPRCEDDGGAPTVTAAAPTAQQYREVMDELCSIKYSLKQLDQQRRQDLEVQQRMAQMIEDLQRQLHTGKRL